MANRRYRPRFRLSESWACAWVTPRWTCFWEPRPRPGSHCLRREGDVRLVIVN